MEIPDKNSRRGILVGFTYQTGRRPLIGSLVDLYRVYKFLQKQGFLDLHLVTDVDKDPSSQDYRQAIIEGHVDADLLSFISEMQHKKAYHYLLTPDDLTKVLPKLLQGSRKTIIYLTGHGEEHGFVCPSGIVKWPDLQDSIFSPLKKEAEVMMILDACHGWHFDLPYCLDREDQGISDKARNLTHLSFVGRHFFPTCHFMLLVTTSKEAAATVTGSLVTQALISFLDKGYNQSYLLRRKIEERLRMTETLRSMNLRVDVYTSHPTLYRLWSWLRKKEEMITAYGDDLFITLNKEMI
ncbi:MAG: caspase family protein [Solirubrobacteraceae bacterium]